MRRGRRAGGFGICREALVVGLWRRTTIRHWVHIRGYRSRHGHYARFRAHETQRWTSPRGRETMRLYDEGLL